jgi:hypothetical protein
MSTNFSTSLDSFTNPGPNDAMNASPALDHDVQHANENDAITALETKVGIDGSAVTGSLDYKSKNGSFIRKTAAATTTSLANGATDSAETLTIGKGCMLVKITVTCAAWVRIYASAADQSADASRLQTADPVAGTGVLLDVVTTGNQTIDLSPMVFVASLEGSPGATLPITVKNNATTQAITVTVTLIPVEG